MVALSLLSDTKVFTSHGYQFNSHIFLGGGVAYLTRLAYDERALDYLLPVYAHFRYNFLSKRVSPFVEVKAGYSLAGVLTDAYSEASLGLRIGVGRKGQAVNVALGGIVLGAKGEYTAGNFKVFFEL